MNSYDLIECFDAMKPSRRLRVVLVLLLSIALEGCGQPIGWRPASGLRRFSPEDIDTVKMVDKRVIVFDDNSGGYDAGREVVSGRTRDTMDIVLPVAEIDSVYEHTLVIKGPALIATFAIMTGALIFAIFNLVNHPKP